MQKKSYKFRLYPIKKQEKKLEKALDQACGDTVRPCFEFEKMKDKVSVSEAGNYQEIV